MMATLLPQLLLYSNSNSVGEIHRQNYSTCDDFYTQKLNVSWLVNNKPIMKFLIFMYSTEYALFMCVAS